MSGRIAIIAERISLGVKGDSLAGVGGTVVGHLDKESFRRNMIRPGSAVITRSP